MEQEEKEMRYEEKIALVPVWKKCMLSLEEAVAFTGIGRDRLLELSDQDNCDFVIWSGRKRLFKRKGWKNLLNSLPNSKIYGRCLWESGYKELFDLTAVMYG